MGLQTPISSSVVFCEGATGRSPAARAEAVVRGFVISALTWASLFLVDLLLVSSRFLIAMSSPEFSRTQYFSERTKATNRRKPNRKALVSQH
jgi:hypothetical protein